MTAIKYIFLFVLTIGTLQGQSKKELQKKYEDLQKKNLNVEKSNARLTEKVENLTERVKRLEKELATAQESRELALKFKDEALKSRDIALKEKEGALEAQIKVLKSKEALFEEKKRMEEIFAKVTKGKSNLKQITIAGRYYKEGASNEDGGYMDLFEDGTLYLKVSKEEKKESMLDGISGTYKLRGSRLTFIVSIFTITKAIEATVSGNRITILNDHGKKEVYIREK